MAEAALKFHDVFRLVDEAAALFTENVHLRQKEQEEAFQKRERENQEACAHILSNARKEAELIKQDADQTLQNANDQAHQVEVQAKANAEQIVREANEQADRIIAQAEGEADRQAQRAEEIIRQAQEYVVSEMEQIEIRWAEIHEKIESMSKEYVWLRGIINREGDTPRQKAGEIIQEAQQRAQEIVSQAQEQAATEMEKIDSRWNGIYERIRGMEKEYSWLHGIINKKTGEEA